MYDSFICVTSFFFLTSYIWLLPFGICLPSCQAMAPKESTISSKSYRNPFLSGASTLVAVQWVFHLVGTENSQKQKLFFRLFTGVSFSRGGIHWALQPFSCKSSAAQFPWWTQRWTGCLVYLCHLIWLIPTTNPSTLAASISTFIAWFLVNMAGEW